MAGKFVDVTLRLIDKMSTPLNAVGGKLADSSRQWQKAGREITRTGKRISAVGMSLTKSVTAPVVALGTASVLSYGKVDKSLRLVEATMGKAKWATGDMEAAIKKAASSSVFSMQDATDATLNFARQGFNAKKASEMLTPALDLAAGTATDLSTVTGGLGNSLKLFGDSGLTAAKASDVFAKAQAQANTTTSDLFNAMSVGGPIFKTVGWGLEDLAAATGVFGDNSITGSEGATAMKTGIARLVSPAKEGAQWIKKLNLNVTNSNGTMKSFTTVQNQLHDAFAGLNKEEQVQAASAIFGKNQMSKWLALINTAPKTVKNYRTALDDAAGTAHSMADALMSGVGGSIEKLKSTFDVFQYSVGKIAGETVKPLIDKTTELLGKFNNLDEATQKVIVKSAMVAAAVGPAILVFGKMTTGIGRTVSAIGRIGGAFRKFGSIAKIITSPAGIVIGVLAGIALAAFLIIKNWNKIKPVLQNVKSWFLDTFGGAGGAFEKFGQAFGIIKKMVTPGLKSLSSWLSENIPKAVDAMGAAAGKAGAFLLDKLVKGINIAADIALRMAQAFEKGTPKVKEFAKNGIEKIVPILSAVGKAAIMAGATIMSGLSRGFQIALPYIKITWKVLSSVAIVIGKNLLKVAKAAGPVFMSAFRMVGAAAKLLFKLLVPIIARVGSILKSIGNKFLMLAKSLQVPFAITTTVIGGVIKFAINGIGTMFQGLMGVLSGICDFVTGVFAGNWRTAWEGVKNVFSGIFGSLGGIAKQHINVAIALANNAIRALNMVKIDIPDWVPKMGGESFGINIPLIPALAKGTKNWMGGLAQVSEKGGEIIDLPKGSRVYPHDESVRKAYSDGRKAKAGGTTVQINIPKLADQIVIREDADIDRIAERIARKLEKVAQNIGGGDIEYIY